MKHTLVMKPLRFLGTSLQDLKTEFPVQARRKAGFQLKNVQTGKPPGDWKPMTTIGASVMELRIRVNGEYRVIYVAKFVEAVYVLHVFAKQTSKPPKTDLDLARRRYQQLLIDRQKL